MAIAAEVRGRNEKDSSCAILHRVFAFELLLAFTPWPRRRLDAIIF